MANRAPTSTARTNDVLDLFDDIWGALDRRFQPIWGPPGVRAIVKHYLRRAATITGVQIDISGIWWVPGRVRGPYGA